MSCTLVTSQSPTCPAQSEVNLRNLNCSPHHTLTVPGVLIECDPSIKSIIVNIDSDNHDFIIEDLDEERVVVKENMVPLLKQKLEDVRNTCHPRAVVRFKSSSRNYARNVSTAGLCPY